jgi:hypothetical protein
MPNMPSGPGGANNQNAPQGPQYYMTLEPKFREVIQRAENEKKPLILYAEKADGASPVADMYYFNELLALESGAIKIVALTLYRDPQLMMRIVASCRDKDVARTIRDSLEKILTKAADDKLQELTGIKFHVNAPAATEGQDNQPGGPSANYPGGGAGGNAPGMPGMPGMVGGGGGSKGMPGAGSGNRPGFPPPGGGGGGNRGLPGAGSNQPPPGYQNPGPNAPGGEAPLPEAPNSTIDVNRHDEFITIVVNVNEQANQFIENQLAGEMIWRRAKMDLGSGRRFLGDFASTLQTYNRDSQRPVVFPFGAHPRDTDASRGYRPYPPFEKVSWMREMLPYMGDSRYLEMHGAINPKKSWRDPDNLKVARILVSQFVNPESGNYFVRVRGVDRDLAVTHFVGMAGVGPDAPYYPKTDPRAGIFGYDRQTALSDIKDGASNTIYAIQTDPGVAGPWLAGGGSTIRGTSGGDDVGQRGGFLSPKYNGKDGAFALMADASIRYLTKGIDRKVFEALCTMNGGDDVGDIEGVAPRARIQPTLQRTAPSPSAAPAAETPAPSGAKPPAKSTGEEDEAGKPAKPAKPPEAEKKP